MKEGISVIMTTHFPDHAFLCATKVGLITREWVRFGTPDEVVTEDSLKETYGVDVRIVKEHTCKCGTLKGCIPIVEFAAAGDGADGIRDRMRGIPSSQKHVAVCA